LYFGKKRLQRKAWPRLAGNSLPKKLYGGATPKYLNNIRLFLNILSLLSGITKHFPIFAYGNKKYSQ